MSKSKKVKKSSKYKTRTEKNKKIYYKSNSYKYTPPTKNKNYSSVIIVALVVSLIFNVTFLFKLSDLKLNLTELNSTVEDYIEDIDSYEVNYANYVFLGDSITDYYDLDKYYENMPVVNSGVSGNTTDDILDDMENRVYQYNPSKVFLLIGTNDLQKGKDVDYIVDNIIEIVEEIQKNRSKATIYVEGIYPVDEDLSGSESRKNDDINEINEKLKEYCDDNNITYINTHDRLTDEDGKLKEEYTDDGLHLSEEGYEVVTDEIMKYLD